MSWFVLTKLAKNHKIQKNILFRLLLRKVPSLKRELPNAIIDVYPDALDLAIDETGLSESTFPKTCPYTIEQLLDKHFYPENGIILK